ncbi:uncharacterized protein IWZ02DRAFT_198733 [Phyllosticta citriasiana]|uniref:uncharacterized protein n=1 Tax=Phyllosticta citriasiana TaxID=595635 RepID=UPI0030FD6492
MKLLPILLLLTMFSLPKPTPATLLSPRQISCALPGSSTDADCKACLGPNAASCGRTGCFDPSAGQTCCADGSACSGGDECCGEVGLGVSGSSDDDDDGHGTGTSSTTTPTTTTKKTSPTLMAATSTVADWSCAQSDDGDACCARRGEGVRYCGGAWPTYTCYRPGVGEVCCAGDNAARTRACTESGTGTGGSGEGGRSGQVACCDDVADDAVAASATAGKSNASSRELPLGATMATTTAAVPGADELSTTASTVHSSLATSISHTLTSGTLRGKTSRGPVQVMASFVWLHAVFLAPPSIVFLLLAAAGF